MVHRIIVFYLFTTILISCKYDITPLNDIKFSLEGEYFCSVYHYTLDTINGGYINVFTGYDTISIHALEGDSAVSLELDGVYYETQMVLLNDVLFSSLATAHKYVYFFPPDSLHYHYSPGLGPNSYDYYGIKME